MFFSLWFYLRKECEGTLKLSQTQTLEIGRKFRKICLKRIFFFLLTPWSLVKTAQKKNRGFNQPEGKSFSWPLKPAFSLSGFLNSYGGFRHVQKRPLWRFSSKYTAEGSLSISSLGWPREVQCTATLFYYYSFFVLSMDVQEWERLPCKEK